MDDIFDDGIISFTCPSSTEGRNEDSSQVACRLSSKFIKRRKKTGFITESVKMGNSATQATSQLVSQEDGNQSLSTNEKHFCPTCQAPFEIIKIDPHIHASNCKVSWDDLEECKQGEFCNNARIYHYRDYAHSTLAEWRSSTGHISTCNVQSCITPDKLRHKMACMSPLTQSSVKKKKQNSNSGKLYVKNKSLNINSSSHSASSAKRNIFQDVSLLNDSKISSQNKLAKVCLSKSAKSNELPLNNNTKTSDYKSAEELNNNDKVYSEGSYDMFHDDAVKALDNSLKSCSDIQGSNSDESSVDRSLKENDNKIINEKNSSINTKNTKTNINKKLSNKKCNSFSKNKLETLKKQEVNDNIMNNVSLNYKSEPCNTDHNKCKVKESISEDETNKNYECRSKLKLDAIVEYTNEKLTRELNGNKIIKTFTVPCRKNEDIKLNEEKSEEVQAVMSVVLSPTKQKSSDGEAKLRSPVKIDASCNEMGWETIGITASQDADINDVKISICNCAKTMHVNCSVSQKSAVESSDEKINDNDFESNIFLKIKELGVSNIISKKNYVPELPNHQMSITSYFQDSNTSKVLDKNQPPTLYVNPNTASVSVVQDNSFCASKSESCTINPEVPLGSTETNKKRNEESVNQWKKILKVMSQKGQSTMSVMTDDSISIASDSHTSNSGGSSRWKPKSNCPSYKKIPDTSFVVDAFQYGCIPGITHYFLTHFHSDHYTGLRKSFSMPIYCTNVTAALVKMKLRVDEKFLHILELDTPRKINGVLVTALDANHCPGSAMLLFELQDGRNFLHVGDFRADPKMESYPCFWDVTIDKLFLDTTYCEPRYTFPYQSEILERVADLALEHYNKALKTLFICGTYTIGKEKVFLAIAEALNCKIWACAEKRRVLECINDPIINQRLTSKMWDAQVHVCRMCDLNYVCLQRYLYQHKGIFTHIAAFKPTGWEMQSKSSDILNINTKSYGNITIYGVPYSEHSSFRELKRFVQFLKPNHVIPTVNMEHPAKRVAMQRYFKQWLSEWSNICEKRKSENEHYVQQKMVRYVK